MAFQIIRNDITKVNADVIVNTANPEVAIGDGVDSAIYMAAGKDRLLAEREKIGYLTPGEVAIAPAFLLVLKLKKCFARTCCSCGVQYTEYAGAYKSEDESRSKCFCEEVNK